ncbi:unnamed protein product, partial [Effrenium voratum]
PLTRIMSCAAQRCANYWRPANTSLKQWKPTHIKPMLVTAVDHGDFENILKELRENNSGKKNADKTRHKA